MFFIASLNGLKPFDVVYLLCMERNSKRGGRVIITNVLSVIIALLCFAALLCTSSYGNENNTVKNMKVAVDPSELEQGYAAILYDNSNGLPTNDANDIAQTEEGFIWIGSYGGLIRYDGNDFVKMNGPDFPIASVKCLLVDSQNRLWVGTNDSGLVMMNDKGEFKRWKLTDGLPSESVRSIVEDKYGDFYVATTGGIAIIDKDLKLTVLEDERLKGQYIQQLLLSTDDNIYGLSNNGDLFIVYNRNIIRFFSKDEIGGEGANSVLPDPKRRGYVYLEMGNSEMRYGNPRSGIGKMKKIDISPLSQVTNFEYINDKIWVCARNGLGVLDDKGIHVVDGLPLSSSVSAIFTDFAGNLWFTSTRQGVMKVVPNRFSNMAEAYHLGEIVANTTCEMDNKLLVGTDTGLLAVDKKGVVEEIPLTKAVTASGEDLGSLDLMELLKGSRIRSIIRDSKDRIWISTWRSHGLLCYDNGEVTAYSADDGLYSDLIRMVYEREDGSYLVACSGGVNILKDGKVVGGYGEEEGIDNTEILNVCEGENGDILVGSDGGGIYIIGDEGIKNIDKSEGLTSGAVMRIKKDEKHGVYWVICGTSLAYLRSDYELFTITTFPSTNNFDMYEDANGNMWVLSGDGLYIESKEKLLANKVKNPTYYSTSNGLPCITTSNSYSELTDEGVLYIAGSSNVTRVDINDTEDYSGAMKASVPFVDADGKRLYPDKSGSFNIPENVMKLTIYPYVFNYSLSDPLVSYELEGFDTSATTVNRSEMAPVTYTNLRGGDYKFKMEILDSTGHEVRNITCGIQKAKAYYEKKWFYVLVGALALLGVFCVVRYAVRRTEKRMEAIHKEKAEKERLVSELDTAKQIQVSVLPNTFPAFPDRDDFDIYATMEAAREVGGDFYDFFLIDDDHLGLVMADVSGKGIPAALMMMVAKSIIKNLAMIGISPSEILEQANESICSSNDMEMFVTVWLGILELSTGKLTAANAGHEYPALMKADSDFELVKDKHGFVIGGMEGMKYTDYELKLEPGDKIFLYTDGVPEATNSKEELFGTDRMVDALNVRPGAPPEEILANVHQAVDDFVKEAEQFDDLTMMCVEYTKKRKGNKKRKPGSKKEKAL